MASSFLGRVHGATISKYAGLPRTAAASIRMGTSGRSGYTPSHAARASAKIGGIHRGSTGENRAIGRPASANSCSPINRRCRRGRVRGSLRRVDLYRDGQQADQPTCLIERQRHHPGTRGGRIQRRHDIGAANWHQPPGAVPVPEEQRRRLRRGERAPSRGRSVVLVDCTSGSRYRSHIRRLHRLRGSA